MVLAAHEQAQGGRACLLLPVSWAGVALEPCPPLHPGEQQWSDAMQCCPVTAMEAIGGEETWEGQGRAAEHGGEASRGLGVGGKIFTRPRALKNSPCLVVLWDGLPSLMEEGSGRGAATPAAFIAAPTPPLIKSWLHPCL